jgi:hypothetical protein
MFGFDRHGGRADLRAGWRCGCGRVCGSGLASGSGCVAVG